jgi:hypothetical protein
MNWWDSTIRSGKDHTFVLVNASLWDSMDACKFGLSFYAFNWVLEGEVLTIVHCERPHDLTLLHTSVDWILSVLFRLCFQTLIDSPLIYLCSTRQDGQDLLQMQLWMQRMLIKPSSWGYYCSGNDSVLNLFHYAHSHVPHDNNRTHYSWEEKEASRATHFLLWYQMVIALQFTKRAKKELVKHKHFYRIY